MINKSINHESEPHSIISTNLEMGLNDEQIKKSIELNGKNVFKEAKNKPFIFKFFSQFLDPMILLLVVATIISVAVLFVPDIKHNIGLDPNIENILRVIEYVEPCIIILIVLLNAFFGASQEHKAEKALEELKKITSPICKVIRNGIFQKLSSEQVVVGDLLVLDAGDSIVADGKVIEDSSLKCEESILTGESLPTEKSAKFISKADTPIGDRKDYVFAGTSVVNGRGKILVTKIGMKTEIGKIAELINKNSSTLSPLQIKMGKLSRFLGLFAIVVCLISFIIYIAYVNNIDDIQSSWVGGLKTSISLAIAAIPEGLMAITTVVLAFGIKRMIKHNALIKKLPAVEALGSASVICSDKTGTLTQNKMKVVKVFIKNKFTEDFQSIEAKELMKYSILCNDTKMDKTELIGDPTETSMFAFAKVNNFDIENNLKKFPRLEEVPFDSDRKMMTTIHKINNEFLVITKGAFDQILKKCKVDAKTKKDIEDANLSMGNNALRVIAFAIKKIKKIPSKKELNNIENNLNFVGLLGIIDPPREEAKIAIKQCIDAGIRPIMITGDHLNTAVAIAKELGVINLNQKAISGHELEQMSESDFRNNIEQYSVYARVSPIDKIRIVKAWQSKNKVVAMTGDGVNDAPALQAADIGCAMGITGTEVAKGAADMILTDDNFATIVEAVKEGRGILDNIKRLVLTLLTICCSELINILAGMLIFHFSPFTTLQILWINLLGESFPGIALGLKKPEKNIMQFKPNNLNQPILTKSLLIKVFVQSIFLGGLALLTFYLGVGSFVNFDYEKIVYVLKSYNTTNDVSLKTFAFNMQMAGSSLTFIFFSLVQIINPLNLFSKKSIFSIPFKELKPLLIAILFSSCLTFIVSFAPSVNDVFNSNALIFSSNLGLTPIIGNSVLGTINDFSYIANYQYLVGVAIALVFLPTIVFELLKLINNSNQFKQFSMNNKLLTKIKNWN